MRRENLFNHLPVNTQVDETGSATGNLDFLNQRKTGAEIVLYAGKPTVEQLSKVGSKSAPVVEKSDVPAKKLRPIAPPRISFPGDEPVVATTFKLGDMFPTAARAVALAGLMLASGDLATNSMATRPEAAVNRPSDDETLDRVLLQSKIDRDQRRLFDLSLNQQAVYRGSINHLPASLKADAQACIRSEIVRQVRQKTNEFPTVAKIRGLTFWLERGVVNEEEYLLQLKLWHGPNATISSSDMYSVINAYNLTDHRLKARILEKVSSSDFVTEAAKAIDNRSPQTGWRRCGL